MTKRDADPDQGQAVELDERLWVGPQPNPSDLAMLAGEGFGSVVNLREPDEENQPISPADEERRASELGMGYVRIPVARQGPTPEQVDRFRQEVATLRAPIYVHSGGGARAALIALAALAVEEGVSGAVMLEKARQLGHPCDDPAVAALLKAYVDARTVGRTRQRP